MTQEITGKIGPGTESYSHLTDRELLEKIAAFVDEMAPAMRKAARFLDNPVARYRDSMRRHNDQPSA